MKQAGRPSAPNPTATGPIRIHDIPLRYPMTTAYIALVLIAVLLMAVAK